MFKNESGARGARRGLVMVVAAGVLLAGGVALAHTPGITIDPIGPQQYATFPQNYNVTGTASHTGAFPPPGPNGDNVCALNAMKVLVHDGVTETVLLDQGNPAGFFGWACTSTSAAWNASWSIPGPGTYTLTAKVKHQSDEGTATEEVVVTQLVVGQCPAAPAVASDYLKDDLGWKPVSGRFKGVMKQVAAETGAGGSLWAGNACDAGYRDQVVAFVNGII